MKAAVWAYIGDLDTATVVVNGVLALTEVGFWTWATTQHPAFRQGFSDYMINGIDNGTFKTLWAAREGWHTYRTGKRRYIQKTFLTYLLEELKMLKAEGTVYFAFIRKAMTAFVTACSTPVATTKSMIRTMDQWQQHPALKRGVAKTREGKRLKSMAVAPVVLKERLLLGTKVPTCKVNTVSTSPLVSAVLGEVRHAFFCRAWFRSSKNRGFKAKYHYVVGINSFPATSWTHDRRCRQRGYASIVQRMLRKG